MMEKLLDVDFFLTHLNTDKAAPVAAYVNSDDEGRAWLMLRAVGGEGGRRKLVLRFALGDLIREADR